MLVLPVDEVLEGGGAQLQGDVPELSALLHAEVTDHVRVLITLPRILKD